jgi:leucyl aminopeptidase (aminopeptidase T)/DNA-binding transcriptional ArsR family regulator
VDDRNDKTSSPRRELTVVERDAQIKALANPERVRILTLLVERSGTAKQVADWIGGTRGRVHYHIKELEKAGLVEKVRTVETGGVVEKYYRAVARNFYLGRGIGEYAGLAGDVREMISRSMLGWRRREMLAVDQDEIAQKVVRDCLDTKDGEVVVIKGDLIQRDIMQPLNRAVEAAGGSCINISTPGELGSFLLKWKRDISSVIVIEEPLEYPILGGAVDPQKDIGERRVTFMKSLVQSGRKSRYAGIPGYPLEDPVARELMDTGKRIIYLGYPTPRKAEIMGIDFRERPHACWSALDVDYRDLKTRCEELRTAMDGGKEVRVTSPGGTDLTFRIEGREVFIDDGIISTWEVEHGRGWGHLPAGKVIVAPVAGTANGVLHSEMTDYFGVRIGGIRIEFRDGEVVKAAAEQNDELLQLVISEGKGDVRKLGGFEIGMNPEILEPIGYAVWDSKTYGDATLWIGDNMLIGGENEASLSWGFMVVRPSVSLDGKTTLEDRTFHI